LVGSLAGCGGGGHEAHSGPSTPIGIKYKWKAVGIQVKRSENSQEGYTVCTRDPAPAIKLA